MYSEILTKERHERTMGTLHVLRIGLKCKLYEWVCFISNYMNRYALRAWSLY